MSNVLKKITTRAKQIYAKGGTWRGAIKKAGAEFRGSKSSTPKRSKRRRVTVRKTRKRRVANVWPVAVAGAPSVNLGIGGHMKAAKDILLQRIGEKETMKFKAKLKRDKKRIQKDISALKKQYKKFC